VNKSEVITSLQTVISEVLSLNKLIINENTTADMVEGWDSLSHLQIILKIEEVFKIEFDIDEITTFQNIGDLVSIIMKK